MSLGRAGSGWSLVTAAAVIILGVGCGSKSDGMTDSDGGSEPLKWCDAYEIINCVCQQCHESPPVHGAPIPLMTYADTQAPFPMPTSNRRVWQEMQIVIADRSMPFTGDMTVMPPVQPLTDEQQSTLLTWLAEGAHDEGGQACPMTCDWSKGSPGSR